MYDRRVYIKEFYDAIENQKKIEDIDSCKNLYLIGWWRIWESIEMWNSMIINPEIEAQVNNITSQFSVNTIGVHIRRTDNKYSIESSPTHLFIEEMEKELEINPESRFYLATDSYEEKNKIQEFFCDKVISLQNIEMKRNTPKGIIDAFVEINALSKTTKIFASAYSSFSELAALLSGIECVIIKK